MNDKIKVKEKMCYAMLTLGNVPTQTLLGSYLLIYYTNVVGLSIATCATLFLIARILDGINDPIVGYLIDHFPKMKLGRFRGPLIIGGMVCALNFLLLWFGPLFSPVGKVAIAYVSYIAIGVSYPMFDIPFSSLLPVMTADMKERNSLSSIRGIMAFVGALIIAILAPIILGDTSNRQGYINLILLATAMIVIFTIIGTLGVKERIQPRPESKYEIRDMVKIFRLRPVWVAFFTSMIYMLGSYIQSTTNLYFYTYIYGDISIMSFMALMQPIGMIIGMILVGKLTTVIGKKRLFVVGFLISGLSPLMRLIDVVNIPIMLTSSVCLGIGTSLILILNFNIQADNTDYVEMKLGKRAEAAIAALSTFVMKCGMGIGAAIPGYLLAWQGYDAEATVQASNVNTTIIICLIVIPSMMYMLAGIFFGRSYPINKQALEEQNIYMSELRKATE